jgi:hypothetical protein
LPNLAHCSPWHAAGSTLKKRRTSRYERRITSRKSDSNACITAVRDRCPRLRSVVESAELLATAGLAATGGQTGFGAICLLRRCRWRRCRWRAGLGWSRRGRSGRGTAARRCARRWPGRWPSRCAGAGGMVTTLPPLRVINSVRCPRSSPRCSMSAPAASDTSPGQARKSHGVATGVASLATRYFAGNPQPLYPGPARVEVPSARCLRGCLMRLISARTGNLCSHARRSWAGSHSSTHSRRRTLSSREAPCLSAASMQ